MYIHRNIFFFLVFLVLLVQNTIIESETKKANTMLTKESKMAKKRPKWVCVSKVCTIVNPNAFIAAGIPISDEQRRKSRATLIAQGFISPQTSENS